MIIALKGTVASAGGLAYRWVAVGANGKLYTSDSNIADTWTSRTSSFSADDINAVASNKESLYVAVGSAGKLATSPDGITWTQQTSSFSTTAIYGIAYGNGTWVAVGASGKAATSTDGVTWTQRTSSFSTDAIWAVAWGNGNFVAVGAAGKLATSPDGITWTQRTDTIASIGKGVAYSKADAIWVSGTDAGTTGAWQSATDPTGTWTARDAPTTATASSTITFAAGGGNFVVVYATTELASSTNGTSWTARTESMTADNLKAVAYDNAGTWIIGGDALFGGITYWRFDYSTNSTTWNTANHSVAADNQINAVCHSSGTEALN